MAKEYIEREAFLDILEAKAEMAVGTPKQVFNSAYKMLELLPAADVVEVVHGVWKMAVDEADYEYGTCSECGNREYDAFCTGRIPNYCSNCGAKMDGERKEQR